MTVGDVGPEAAQPILITPHRIEVAGVIVELADLEDHADKILEMYGESDTVLRGIARCYPHFGIALDINIETDPIDPEKINNLKFGVMTRLEQQGLLD